MKFAELIGNLRVCQANHRRDKVNVVRRRQFT